MVRISKPSWVVHETPAQGPSSKPQRNPIMSLDVQPGGDRLATGGQDGRVLLWALDSMFSDDKEKHRSLACLREHTASINCVRWSPDEEGIFLASAADDCHIHLWMQMVDESSQGEGEDWRALVTFKGHSMDVTCVGWSLDSKFLASCSVDNTVRIWAVENGFRRRTHRTVVTQVEAVLKGHNGWVKGVAWDPVGTYLATASDDKSVIVWRTADWKQETVITSALEDGSTTTFKRQLSWSPEGLFLCISHAFEHPRNVAYVVERGKWQDSDSAVRFVGHPKAVSLTRFSPTIYSHKSEQQKVESNYTASEKLSTVCAIACNDRVVSVWSPGSSRALAVFRNLMEEKLLDLCWSCDGVKLIICGMEGRIACVSFDEFERIPQVGKALSRRETDALLRKNYGDMGRTEPSLPETTAQLILEESKLISNNTISTTPGEVKMNGEHKATNRVNILMPKRVQTETVTVTGKRRIAPAFLSGPTTTPVKKVKEAATPSRIRPRLVFTNPSYKTILEASGMSCDSKVVLKTPTESTQVEVAIKENSLLRFETVLKRRTNGVLDWTTKIDGQVSAVCSSKYFTCASTNSGVLNIFGKQGELLVNAIHLCLPVAHLAANGVYLLALLTNASIMVWDVRLLKVTVKCLLDPVIKWIGEGVEPVPTTSSKFDKDKKSSKQVDVCLTQEGTPVATLVDTSAPQLCQAFAFHASLHTWTAVSDPLTFMHSDYYSSLSTTNTPRSKRVCNSGDRSSLAKLEITGNKKLQEVENATRLISESIGLINPLEHIHLLEEKDRQQDDVSRMHVEALVASALVMASREEYKHWNVQYCTRLCETGDIKRLRALLTRFLGPLHCDLNKATMLLESSESDLENGPNVEFEAAWEPTVLGIDKRQFLKKKLLPLLASNRELQRLANEFNSMVETQQIGADESLLEGRMTMK